MKKIDYKLEAAKLLSLELNEIETNEILGALEVPPKSEMGDYAYPCFRLAKIFRKAPNMIAEELAKKLVKCELFEKITSEGGYINFFTDKSAFAKDILNVVLELGDKFGSSDIGGGKNVVIDYSSPNIAKPFHVGHLRSTVIGRAIYNIYNKLGYTSVGVNHLGDWGTQFGKLIVAYKKWGEKERIEQEGISALNELYVRFHTEAENNPALDDEARAYFVKMQEGESEALKLWKWFYDISIKDFERVYKILGVSFDAYTGESFYNDKMAPIVKEIEDKGLLSQSEGAMIVSLDEFDMPPCLILRTDGGTLYATRDITAALYRKNTYDFERSIYITAIDQNLHFAQFFKVIEKMGYAWAKDELVHVPFGLVSLQGSKLSTRKGQVVLMEDLLSEAIKKTKNIIEEKNPDLPNKEDVARQVGIGAVIFDDLYNGRIKDVVFSWERMLNFDGETGPYVQYTHARACSVLRKAGEIKADKASFDELCDDASVEVLKLLNTYPEKIVEAAQRYEPSVIARHLVNISQAFNRFYHDNVVLVDDEGVKNARLMLVDAARSVLKDGLAIIGLEAPEQM